MELNVWSAILFFESAGLEGVEHSSADEAEVRRARGGRARALCVCVCVCVCVRVRVCVC